MGRDDNEVMKYVCRMGYGEDSEEQGNELMPQRVQSRDSARPTNK